MPRSCWGCSCGQYIIRDIMPGWKVELLDDVVDAGRALYVAASGRRVVIVLAFLKKTRKTPDRLIELALKRARRIES
jgi:phage-related protein